MEFRLYSDRHAPRLSRPPSAAAPSQGMLQYDPAASVWTDLSPAMKGAVPPARTFCALTAVGGGIYLFGGFVNFGAGFDFP